MVQPQAIKAMTIYQDFKQKNSNLPMVQLQAVEAMTIHQDFKQKNSCKHF